MIKLARWEKVFQVLEGRVKELQRKGRSNSEESTRIDPDEEEEFSQFFPDGLVQQSLLFSPPNQKRYNILY